MTAKKLIYLEAGSGVECTVNSNIISAVKKATNIPLLVKRGIKTDDQKKEAYNQEQTWW